MEIGIIVNLVILWLVVLLNFLLTLALIRKRNAGARSERERSLQPGTIAPDFTAQTVSDGTVTRATYAGQKVVFFFISTSCPPCHEMLPTLETLGPRAAAAGVQIILVSAEGKEATSALVEQFNISLPVLVAPRAISSFFEDYKAFGTPSYCFVNEQGKVQSAGYPSMEWGDWKALAESWSKNGALVAPAKA